MPRILIALFVLLSLSCAAPQSAPEPATIENLDLDLTLSALPEGMALVSNQGTSLELQPTAEGEAIS